MASKLVPDVNVHIFLKRVPTYLHDIIIILLSKSPTPRTLFECLQEAITDVDRKRDNAKILEFMLRTFEMVSCCAKNKLHDKIKRFINPLDFILEQLTSPVEMGVVERIKNGIIERQIDFSLLESLMEELTADFVESGKLENARPLNVRNCFEDYLELMKSEAESFIMLFEAVVEHTNSAIRINTASPEFDPEFYLCVVEIMEENIGKLQHQVCRLELLLKKMITTSDTEFIVLIQEEEDISKALTQLFTFYFRASSVHNEKWVMALAEKKMKIKKDIKAAQAPTPTAFKKSPFFGQECANCAISDVKLLSCSRCKLVSYCGHRCQTQHWKYGDHKRFCVAVGDRVPNAVTTCKSTGPECAICKAGLHSEIEKTPCGHTFHSSCLKDVKKYGTAMTCPVCRAPIA
jgi:hypothetical protein